MSLPCRRASAYDRPAEDTLDYFSASGMDIDSLARCDEVITTAIARHRYNHLRRCI